MFNFVYFILELFWNTTVKYRYPIDYHVELTRNNYMVVKQVPIGDKDKKLVFISKQVSYTRIDRLSLKKVRSYRVEVIDSWVGPDMKSKIYIIPELCSGIFSRTKIPHVCAINCIIAKFIEEDVNDLR